MKTVCFMGSHFGMTKNSIEKAKNILISLIDNGYKTFYCGEYGDFDLQINSILFNLKKIYKDITLICVKPYYNENKFKSQKCKKEYQALKSKILYEYEKFDDLDKRIDYIDDEFKYDFFKIKFIYENKFDDVIVCGLENVPYKFRIVECNKWKVKNSDVVVSFCTNKYSNTYKIRQFALKLNKKVVDINDL